MPRAVNVADPRVVVDGVEVRRASDPTRSTTPRRPRRPCRAQRRPQVERRDAVGVGGEQVEVGARAPSTCSRNASSQPTAAVAGPADGQRRVRPPDRAGGGVVQAQVVVPGRRSRSSRGSARSRPRAPSPAELVVAVPLPQVGHERLDQPGPPAQVAAAGSRSPAAVISCHGGSPSARGVNAELQHRPQPGARATRVEDRVERRRSRAPARRRRPRGRRPGRRRGCRARVPAARPARCARGAAPATDSGTDRPAADSGRSHSRWLRCSLPMQCPPRPGQPAATVGGVDAAVDRRRRRRTGRAAAARSAPARPGPPGPSSSRPDTPATAYQPPGLAPGVGVRQARARPAGHRRRGRAAPSASGSSPWCTT